MSKLLTYSVPWWWNISRTVVELLCEVAYGRHHGGLEAHALDYIADIQGYDLILLDFVALSNEPGRLDEV